MECSVLCRRNAGCSAFRISAGSCLLLAVKAGSKFNSSEPQIEVQVNRRVAGFGNISFPKTQHLPVTNSLFQKQSHALTIDRTPIWKASSAAPSPGIQLQATVIS